MYLTISTKVTNRVGLESTTSHLLGGCSLNSAIGPMSNNYDAYIVDEWS